MPPEKTAEKTAEETKEKRDTQNIAVSRELASMVRTIADQRDITMTEVLEKHARPAILREYRKVLEDMQAVFGGEGG